MENILNYFLAYWKVKFCLELIHLKTLYLKI